MNSDCAFRIGKSHTICQDYATTHNGSPHRGDAPAYALIADGCSASPETDIGARLLVKAAERCLPWAANAPLSGALLPKYHAATLAQARSYARNLRLPRECLDATLLTLVANDSDWLAALYGDGVLAAQRKDGVMEIVEIAYAGNAPHYLNYQGDTERLRGFHALQHNATTVNRFWLAPSGDDCVAQSPPKNAFEWKSECRDHPYHMQGRCVDYDWIAALSDGATSFTSCALRDEVGGEEERIPLSEIARELLNFKSTTGLFVQRRMQRFLRQCEARGWRHYDDLTLAVIALEAEA